MQDPGLLLEWLDGAANVPFGEVRERRLSHYLKVGSLQLSGGGLPDDKRRTFASFLKNSKNRRWVAEFLADLSGHSPALYVGETGRLPMRVLQHLRSETDFGIFIEKSTLDWSQLRLFYVNLGSASPDEKPTRTALEYLAATLTIAGRTSRPG